MEKFVPTHEIVITHDNGSISTELVHLLDGAAYTRQEWEGQTSPDWEVNEEGEWLFQGRATPGNGDTVEVRRLADSTASGPRARRRGRTLRRRGG